MIPKVSDQGIAIFNDVFCEKGYFDIDQTRKIIECGKNFGLKPRLHVDEFEDIGGIELAIEAGADDVEAEDDGSIAVITSPEAFPTVKAQIDEAGMTPVMAEITMAPQTYTELDEEMSERIIKMIDLLEELDDVTNVYTNANLAAAYGE